MIRCYPKTPLTEVQQDVTQQQQQASEPEQATS
jgi:hypothetical protein